jgi:hypothetical protein
VTRNLSEIRVDAEAVRTIPLPDGFDDFTRRVQAISGPPSNRLLEASRDAPEVRVARGVALLDEHKPDWRSRIIDVERLSVWSPWCVLGQVYGGYIDGHIALGLGPWVWFEGIYFGFIVSYGA